MPPTSTALAPAPPAPAARRRGVLREVPAVAPAPPPAPALRERLVRRLGATPGVRAVVLGAPAGYGKSTLLAGWAGVDPRPALTVRCGRTARSRARAAEQLARCAAGDPLTARLLVVDGPEVMGDGAFAALTQAAEALPREAVLVVATRCAPLLPLAHLRAGHAVLELGPAELALTRGEVAAEAAAAGVALDDAGVEALMAYTEGWPALVSLAVQALARAGLPAAAVARAADGDVDAYLRDEVLAALDPAAVALLGRAAALDALAPDLCAAALDRPDAAAVLHDLLARGLPLARGGDPGAPRLHPRLRDVLRRELRRCDPAAEARVHIRAAAWLDDRGDAAGALAQATAGGDADQIGGLLWRTAPAAAFDARSAAAAAALQRLPRRRCEDDPRLALVAASLDLARGRGGHAERWAALAADGLAAGAGGPEQRAAAAALTALLSGAGAPAMRRAAAAAAAALPQASPWQALCAYAAGAGAMLAGDTAAACAVLEPAIRRAAVAAPALGALCEAQLALALMLDGGGEAAARRAGHAHARAEAGGLAGHPGLALVPAATALARARGGRFEEARMDLELARRLMRDLDGLPPWWEAQLHLALGRAELRLSAVGPARADLATAAELAARVPDAPALDAAVAAARADADAFAADALDMGEALTAAELRVMRLLPTHLSFREMGDRLHVSANTIKSQAHAVYRKLGASSRSAAVDRALLLGLIDP